MQSVEAFPLSWPKSRPRTKMPQRARFHRRVDKNYSGSQNTYTVKESLSIAESRDRLYRELRILGATGVVISSNLKLEIDGTPMSAQREPSDPGIAVYFQIRKLPHCLSCDAWDRAADNLAAIAKYVEAMRGQIRWGVADVATMFSGFKSLPGAIVTPAQMTVEQAAQFVASKGGLNASTKADLMESHDFFKVVYRRAAMALHPDAAGMATPEWQQLQDAKQVLETHYANGG